MARILIIDAVHPLIPETFRNQGHQCDFFPDYERADFMQIIGQYDGLIIRSKIRIDRALMERAAKLRFIGRVGAGMENIDVDCAAERGVRCYNSPEGNRDAVGEHATGMLLALMNNMIRADHQVRQGIWQREENRGHEIMGKTVGIIGYGNMGSAFARRLKGFGATVIAYDKYKSGFSDEFVQEAPMERLFNECDILSLHVPLTAETTYLVDEPYLERFTRKIWLLNTARGQVVKTADLVSRLKAGKVYGAALDVLEYEDSSFGAIARENSPELEFLLKSDQVILTPHIAGWTCESNVKLGQVLVEKILRGEGLQRP